MEANDGHDQVHALRGLLQQMLIAEEDEPVESFVPQQSVVRNDRLLELIGVAASELSPTDGCSIGSPEDSLEVAAAPLQLPPSLKHQDCYSVYHCGLDTQQSDNSSSGCFELPPEKDICPGCFSSGIRISKTSAELLRRSATATFEPDFHTRMQQFMDKSEQKRERLRQSLVVKNSDAVPMPRINRESKCIPRSISHLMAWKYEKESKLARMRDAETLRQDEACVGKPLLSKRSVSLCGKRQDDVSQCKVEDRLHLLGLIYQYQQEERKRAQERQETSGVEPRLAPHSVNIQRRPRLSVHERLYQLSKREDAARSSIVHEHHPRNSKRERSNNECFEGTVKRLYAMEKQYKEKQQLLGDMREQYFENLRKEPKMSARSRKLAAKRKQYYTPKSPARCGCCGGREDPEGKCSCTVQTRVNTKLAAEIYDRHLRWKHSNDAKHSQQKKLQETLAMAECTFRNPFYQKARNGLEDQPDNPLKPSSRAANVAFFERSMLWAEKRDTRVAGEKKVAQEQQLKECTFKPHVTHQTATVRRGASNQADEDSPSMSRISAFLDSSGLPSRGDLADETLLAQPCSSLDLETLARDLVPEHVNPGGDGGMQVRKFNELR